MALDTAQKRFSMMGIASQSHIVTGFHPTATGLDADSRRAVMWQYSGIAWDLATPIITDSLKVAAAQVGLYNRAAQGLVPPTIAGGLVDQTAAAQGSP